MNVLMVFLGGGIGSILRYAAGLLVCTSAFPSSTLAVNAIGSLAIGLFGGWASRFAWNETTRLFLVTGLCGGFTTFSTFSKESLALAESGRWGAFAAYSLGSVALGLMAVFAGYWLAKQQGIP